MAITAKVLSVKPEGRTNYWIGEVEVILTNASGPIINAVVECILGGASPLPTQTTDPNGKATINFTFFSFSRKGPELIILANGEQAAITVDANPATPPPANPANGGHTVVSCKHCNGDTICRSATTYGRNHSCAVCKIKSGLKDLALFSTVMCSVCSGKGHEIIHTPKPANEGQKKGEAK